MRKLEISTAASDITSWEVEISIIASIDFKTSILSICYSAKVILSI
jgi:hypothetical protein